jgi:molecular chaperone DnaK
MSELNSIFSQASEEMYKAAQSAQTNGDAADGQPGGNAPSDQEVTDVDFEEVKEK